MRSILFLVDFKDFANLKSQGRFEGQRDLAMQKFKHDSVCPVFCYLKLGVGEFGDDGLVFGGQEVDDLWMKAEYDTLVQTGVDFAVVGVGLMVDLDLKLDALIEITIGYDFDDNQRQSLADIVFIGHHLLNLTVVNSKLVLAELVYFLRDFFYVEHEFLVVVDWQVDVHGEQAHEGQHHFLL